MRQFPGVFDARDDADCPAAVRAGFNVDAAHALEALCPSHRGRALGRSAVFGACLGCRTLAPPRPGHPRPVPAVRGEHAVLAGEVHPRLGHQRSQPGEKIQRLEQHVRGAVFVRRLQLITHNTARRERQALLRHGRPGGAIVPPFEVFDAASKGVLDVGMAPFGYILGRTPVTIPMSHGPLFGMDGIDYYAWYYDGGGMQLLEEFYRDVLKLDLVGFPIPTDYPQGLGWFKKPLKSLGDLKGMKYRIYGIGAETYGKLGVAVVTIPGGESVPAMERGVIEAPSGSTAWRTRSSRLSGRALRPGQPATIRESGELPRPARSPAAKRATPVEARGFRARSATG